MKIKLKLLRVSNNLSQENMAQKLGVSTSYYCLVETGKRGGSDKFWSKLKELYQLTDRDIYEIRFN